jgi:hypothetical protein
MNTIKKHCMKLCKSAKLKKVKVLSLHPLSLRIDHSGTVGRKGKARRKNVQIKGEFSWYWQLTINNAILSWSF